MKKTYALAIALTALLLMAASASAETVLNAANGHTYELISCVDGINFGDARTAASEMTLDGFTCPGHLATITSEAENAFVVSALGDSIHLKWIGGFQLLGSTEPAGGWQWVTGEAWSYTNWASGEPNNQLWNGVREDSLVYWKPQPTSIVGWNDAPSAVLYNGYIVEYDCGEVQIDIKPGSFPNSINIDSKGVIPVAILTTDDFDASVVDPFSVTLNGMEVQVKGNSGRAGSMEDVDGDGDLDQIVQIVNLGAFEVGDTTATLTALTYGGVQVFGTDTISIVPAN